MGGIQILRSSSMEEQQSLNRSRIMASVRSKNTAPELCVRRAIHRAGFRYRIHHSELPGSPDLVFKSRKIAVFVNGCFWHWHGCKRSRMPRSNSEYWTAKIERNITRDSRVESELIALGWRVVTIWECSVDQGIVDLLHVLRNTKLLHEG